MSIKMYISDSEGIAHEVVTEVADKLSLMEVIRDNNLTIPAICGGSCACATCHVIIDPDCFEQLLPAKAAEHDLLTILDNPTETSRLSCQIQVTDALHELRLQLAPEES